MLTARLIAILTALRRYFYLVTSDIRNIVVPEDKDGSTTRECMRSLLKMGFVRRHEPRLLEQGKTTAPPIFILTVKGSCALAEAKQDVSLALNFEPNFRDWISLHHYLNLSRLHYTIDQAMAASTIVKQHALYFEHEVISEAQEPWKKYRLNTRIDEKIFCCADSAFETEFKEVRRAWYVEREMGTDTAGRVAAKKTKGYAGMQPFFKKHFPKATDYRVLAFCPFPSWRDQFLAELKNKPGAHLWLACAIQEVTAESFLHGPIFYKLVPNAEQKLTVKGPMPLLPPATPPAGGGSGGVNGGVAILKEQQ